MSRSWFRLFGMMVVALGLLLRLQKLGMRPYHHDEAIHGYDSYQIACVTAQGASYFYEYNPVYHGPFLYYVTGAAFAAFGDSDYVGRTVTVAFGMVLLCGVLMLAPELGRGTALAAAFLLAISPVQIYFSRFLRDDAFIAPQTLFFYGLLYRGLVTRRLVPGLLGVAALAMAFATRENGYIVALIFAASVVAMGGFKVLSCMGGPGALMRSRGLARMRLLWGHANDLMAAWPGMTQGLLILLGFSSFNLTAALLKDREPWIRASAAATVGMAVGAIALALLYVWLRRSTESDLSVYATALGAPTLGVLVFAAIFTVAYTNAFVFPERLGVGLFGALEYWSGQQKAPRLDGPFLYYTSVLLLHEPVTFLFPIGFAMARASRLARVFVYAAGSAAMGLFLTGDRTTFTGVAMDFCRGVTHGRSPVDVFLVVTMGLLFVARAYEDFVAARIPRCFTWLWAFGAFTIYGWAREKVPWLTVHQALPFAILTAMLLVELRTVFRVVLLLAIVVLAAHARWLTLRDGEVNVADPIVYVQTIPQARVAVARAEESLAHGNALVIQSDVTVPFYWYFRHHRTTYPKTIDSVDPKTVYVTGSGYEGPLGNSSCRRIKVSYYAWQVPIWGEEGMGLDGIAALCDWLPGYLLHRDQTPWRKGDFRAFLFVPAEE